ncbi:hypothetical protein G7Z17_g11618 [Cylindrodendrum hubeiense]|uniref:Endothelin-converting enzyme 1 n=1 Tax=Cylindrodendrum hubeiense TaxID=595255 RepID=A0A9P5GZ81_9HYPO|nr:hypothetical protein G7Z17_g11618 [Cylindrodendrum hubeiense]
MAPQNAYDPRPTDLCTTPACIHLASEILSNLATNYTEIDPCTDFDQLVCGNWAAENDVPAGQNSNNVLGALDERVKNALKQILEGPYPSGSDAGWITVDLTEDEAKADKETFAKIQEAYDVCMNYSALEEQGLKYLAAFVDKIVEAFPVTAESNSPERQTYDHATAMGKTLTIFESLGFETTQKIEQVQDQHQPNNTILSITQPPGIYIPAEEDTSEYLELAATLIAAVHPAKITTKKASALMTQVLELQRNVREALAAGAEEVAGYDPEAASPKASLAEIQKLAPQLNYKYVVGQLANEGYVAKKVTFAGSSYYKSLSQIISKTPSEVIQTFFIWQAITSLSPYIESEEMEAYTNFIQRQIGQDTESPMPRWKRCVTYLSDDDFGLTWILSRFFLDKNYSPESKKLTSQIVDTLKDAFLERLETREWASDEVKKASAEKVRAILPKIALPSYPDLTDPILLKEYYADADITLSHVDNALAIRKVNVGNRWATLGKPFDRAQFKFSTVTTNAYYLPQSNAIELEAGFQQFPIYDVDFPSYILYGGMGSVVGHEITHGFDNSGRLFDLTGNLTTWWDKDTIKAFNKKATCFIEQYEKFTIMAPDGTQAHVNGEQTLGENIADAGGVVSSFEAWKKWESKKGKAKNLPGLDKFTHEQLFFLKWGQTWCQNIKPADALGLLSTDTHSPNDARIKLTLSNSAEFNKAFKCPKKEPVCELW